MKTKRFVEIISFGLGLALALLWLFNMFAYQAQAQGGSSGVGNGDFENGPNGDWTEYSVQGFSLILSSTALPLTPHSGEWNAWLGGGYDETNSISQTITITTGQSTLNFWMWIASEDYCGYDFGQVLINDTEVYSSSLCDTTSTHDWVNETLDLSAYIGQNVQLQFRAETDSSLNSNFFIDDVGFMDEATPTPTSTPTSTPTATSTPTPTPTFSPTPAPTSGNKLVYLPLILNYPSVPTPTPTPDSNTPTPTPEPTCEKHYHGLSGFTYYFSVGGQGVGSYVRNFTAENNMTVHTVNAKSRLAANNCRIGHAVLINGTNIASWSYDADPTFYDYSETKDVAFDLHPGDTISFRAFAVDTYTIYPTLCTGAITGSSNYVELCE